MPFHGLTLIWRPGLRRFVVIPLLLNMLIFTTVAYLAGHYFQGFMDTYLPQDGWLSYLRWLFWLVFGSIYLLSAFYAFTILANLIASPFNGVLAARVEELLTGKAPPPDEASVLASIVPALRSELGKLGYFLTRAIPLLVLFLLASLIPGLNLIVGAAWLVFGFWFLAIEYADFPMANHGLTASAQRDLLRGRRLKSLAFGAGVTTLLLIPVIGFAAMPAAVAAATRYWVEDLSTRQAATTISRRP